MDGEFQPYTRFERFKRRAARMWPLGLTLVVLAYLGFHVVHGERGLLAKLDSQRELEVRQAELERLRERRRALERRTEALADDRIDPDVLEEELYKLGYLRQDEVLVLLPKDAPGEEGKPILGPVAPER